jgi:hypothetical protein
MDPVGPFVTYFLEHGEYLVAAAIAIVVIAAAVGAFLVNARRKSSTDVSIQAGDRSQNTIVTGTRSKGDITIAPEQRNE